MLRLRGINKFGIAIKTVKSGIVFGAAFLFLGKPNILEPVSSFISGRLTEREKTGSLRTLKTPDSLVDFCSNDYLGFARSAELKKLIDTGLSSCPGYLLGSTGSRLISGNDLFTEQLESEIASFHQAEAALIFNSGYDANLGLFSSLPQRGDTLITDELIHASVIDGCSLSYANRFIFAHNDTESLQKKLVAAKGRIYIAVESVYSMDGDKAPLAAIIDLAGRYHAALIVDEAHAAGIFGETGRGLVHSCNLQDRVLARTVTFGKALGVHGAAILCSHKLRQYLVNFARPFIYSTAAPFYNHMAVKMAYRHLTEQDHQLLITRKISRFKELTQTISGNFISSDSAIQSMIISGNRRASEASLLLKREGLDVRPIFYPSVPEGKERLRICLHTFNSDEEIVKLANLLKQLI